MNVYKNIQTAVAQAQATYTTSVMNTNNYGQIVWGRCDGRV
ncbi:hypothetical protein ID0576_11410 [Helicobacter pylori]